MGLSCSCGEWDGDGWYWEYTLPRDENQIYTKLKTNRGRKCCSCAGWISVGDDVLEFARFRSANSDIEERIYGDTVRLASWFMCEECGEIFLNLDALGYCVQIDDHMAALLEEYREQHGVELAA